MAAPNLVEANYKREDANSSLFLFMDELSALFNHTKTFNLTKVTKDD